MQRVVFTARSRLVPVDERRLRGVLERILDDCGISGPLSVAFVDDAAIQKIHRDFLGKDKPTDVISFHLDDGNNPVAEDDVFGEVVVSIETARREAAKRGLEPGREVALYAIHGTLHLAGYDDKDTESRRRMRAQERHYLKKWSALKSQ